MSTHKDNRENDRDKDQQNQDRDQKLQNQDRDHQLQNEDRDQLKRNQDRGMNLHGDNEEDALLGHKGQAQQSQDSDPAFPKSKSPQELQDENHRMDRRTNDGEVDGSKKREHQSNNPDLKHDIESRWNDIESDYRKRHPSVTDEDVRYGAGEFDIMTDRLAKRTNRNRQDVNDEIKNWQDSK